MPEKLYSGIFSLSPEQRSVFLKIILLIYEFEAKKKDSYILQASYTLHAFLLDLYHNNEANCITAEGPAVVAYKKIVKCMHEEIYSNLTLGDFAVKNNMSISYMKLLFRSYANTCPKKYYSKLRANEASKMILNGIPVNVLAEKMNFSSPNYFSVYFKKHFGMTPVEYRNAHNG